MQGGGREPGGTVEQAAKSEGSVCTKEARGQRWVIGHATKPKGGEAGLTEVEIKAKIS